MHPAARQTLTTVATAYESLHDPVVFGAARAVVGGASWLVPRTSAKAFGLSRAPQTAETDLVTRLFGVRDVALGALVAGGSEPVRRAALQLGVAVDAADAVATVLAVRKGLSPAAALLVGSAAAGFAITGWRVLQRRA